ncbi:MAG: Asp-tRNA(Asn)/Glu-tRNA(Gln) amidotransferase subunit GatB [Parcubacteria group bacterium]
MKLEAVIGLEFHVQLKTKSKMFCSCANDADSPTPNKNICPICLGHPGVLPKVNAEAVNMALKAALALNCEVANFTKFDRKNYFYPDLPKGYQISQFDKPLALGGWLVINSMASDGLSGKLDDEKQLKRIGIIRLHLEEDSAKSTHKKNNSLIDFNRGGSPLVEIVTAPHMSTPQEAKTFAQEIQLIMRHLEISDADLEKGHLRCDVNVSLRPAGDQEFYPKTEIKNINSFRAMERALEYEIERQTELWKTGLAPTAQETRGWNDAAGETVLQRVKEAEHDYRYFPEPDLPPLAFTNEQIEKVKNEMPELPQAKRLRFTQMFELTGEQAKILTENKALAVYTENVISELQDWLQTAAEADGTAEEIWKKNKIKAVKLLCGWLINKFLPLLDELNIRFAENKITPENFAEFIVMIYQNKINSAAAQIILKEMAETGVDPEHVLNDKDLAQLSSGADMDQIIDSIIRNNPEQAQQYKNGKIAIIKYFVGIVMKETKGKANPQETEKSLSKKLSK